MIYASMTLKMTKSSQKKSKQRTSTAETLGRTRGVSVVSEVYYQASHKTPGRYFFNSVCHAGFCFVSCLGPQEWCAVCA